MRCTKFEMGDSLKSLLRIISSNKMDSMTMDYVTFFFPNGKPNSAVSIGRNDALIIENLNNNCLKMENGDGAGVLIMYCSSTSKLVCGENTLSHSSKPNEFYLEMAAGGSTLLRCDERELRNICEKRVTLELQGISRHANDSAKITIVRANI